MRKSQVLFLCVALAAAGYPARAAESASDDWQSGNLVANGTFAQGAIGAVPEGWRVKAPNLALRPEFKAVEGPAHARLLEVTGNGRKECFGCIVYPVQLAAGKTYRFRVRFRFEGIEDVNRHLLHGVFADGFNDGIFTYWKEGDWVVGENRFPGPAKAVSGEVRLYFRYSAAGKVRWSGVSLQECEPIRPRPVTIAVCQGGGDRKRWEKYLDTAGRKKCDVALMTEFFEEGIQTQDGASMKFMAGKARQWKMYVCGTIRMRRGDLVYNSAPLYDRQGRLVGIYDKFMLYDPELDDGTTPGDSMPVFHADFGKVGIMTCYDSWHPEVARLLAYKGAELILFPSAGYYRQLMHARAADNGVVIAASSGCPCGVWDSGGNQADGGSKDETRYAPTAILAFEKDDDQKMQIVTVDLSKRPSPHSWGGAMLSAPGGRRVRATGPLHLEDEIAREAKRWWEEPPPSPPGPVVEDGPQTVDPRYEHASAAAYERWRDLKYGLRIHWGIYSQYGFEASWPVLKMSNEKKQEYFDSYKRFNPTQFDAEEWMRLFQRCGLKCFAFTAKHHDGFSMWDTKTRVKRRVNWTAPGGPKIEECDLAYSIMETPLRRDVVRELCEAAHRHGIAIDLYFSHIDWYDADFRMDRWNPFADKSYTPESDPAAYARFAERHRGQIREILSNHGPVDMVCLDMELPGFCWPEVKETVLSARRLQPDVLFRERGIGAYGDYTTPENWVPAGQGQTDKRVDRPWMVIYTLSGQFAYDPDGSRYKPGSWILANLIDIVAKGGNFMPSIGPDASGRFHPKAIEQLEYAGDWLRVNGEAIYATRPWKVYKEGEDVRYTRSKDGKHVYAISLQWPGRQLALKNVLPRQGSEVFLLGVREPLAWRLDAQRGLVIEIPGKLQAEENRPCRQAYVFKIPAS
ncbi:MAG: alpha-L-fucosidase [Thermoguttaceae bacterium]